MTLKPNDFCPMLDPLTLLQFQSDAFQAWKEAPLGQVEVWLKDYRVIIELLALSDAGPVRLDLR